MQPLQTTPFLLPPRAAVPSIRPPRAIVPSLSLSSALVALSGFVASRDSVATVAPRRVAS